MNNNFNTENDLANELFELYHNTNLVEIFSDMKGFLYNNGYNNILNINNLNIYNDYLDLIKNNIYLESCKEYKKYIEHESDSDDIEYNEI